MSDRDGLHRIALLREAIAKIESGEAPGRGATDRVQAVRAPPRLPPPSGEAASKARLGGPETAPAGALEAALGGALHRGGLHEIVAASPADTWAAGGFALALAARFRERGGALLWVLEDFATRETGFPYGPGLACHGLDPDRLILVHAARPRDMLWVMEEALRAEALAAVVGELWSVKDYDLTASRRLLLAARGGTPCILFQAGAAGKSARLSSAADTRFEVEARGSRREPAAGGLPLPGLPAWTVRILKARGSHQGLDRDRVFPLVWDAAERCLRDVEPIPTLPIPVDRPAVSGDRAPPAPDGPRRALA